MASLTESVKSTVTQGITKGTYKIGQCLPTTDELATRAGCSVGTVERALSQLAAEGILKRVRNRGTIVVSPPCVGRVCLFLSPDPHTNLLLQDAIVTTLRERGYHTDLIATAGPIEHVLAHCARLRQGILAADCFVAIEPALGSAADEELFCGLISEFERRVAFSYTDRSGAMGCPVVTPDHRKAAQLVMEHLVHLGHRCIGVYSGYHEQETSWASESAGYAREFLSVANIRCLPVYGSQPDIVPQHKKEAVTAYWDLNDNWAVLTMNRCHQQGIRIPADLSVVGRFDTPWSRETSPTLTSISIDPQAVACGIADQLDQQAASRKVLAERILVPPQLVVRESSGPACAARKKASVRRRTSPSASRR